jgi:L-tartrate/succinate antiporter
MFAPGYDKSGPGRRVALLMVRWLGRRTLMLGYAIGLADLALAPFTPSNTARSGGTIYPVARKLPLLYDSKPDDPSARRIGGYRYLAPSSLRPFAMMPTTAPATRPPTIAAPRLPPRSSLSSSW